MRGCFFRQSEYSFRTCRDFCKRIPWDYLGKEGIRSRRGIKFKYGPSKGGLFPLRRAADGRGHARSIRFSAAASCRIFRLRNPKFVMFGDLSFSVLHGSTTVPKKTRRASITPYRDALEINPRRSCRNTILNVLLIPPLYSTVAKGALARVDIFCSCNSFRR